MITILYNSLFSREVRYFIIGNHCITITFYLYSLLLSDIASENENNQKIELNLPESNTRKSRKNLGIPKNPEIYVENESDYGEEDPFTENRGDLKVYRMISACSYST